MLKAGKKTAQTDKTEKKRSRKRKRFHLKKILPKWSSKNIRNGSYSIGAVVIVIAIVVVVNMIVGELPSGWTSFDLSDSGLYSIGDTTKDAAGALEEDVSIYLIAESGSEDDLIVNLLERYEELSSHITVEQIDPVLNPNFTSQYTDDTVDSNSVIVVSEKRSKVINYTDMYETTLDYSTYSYQTTGFDGEGQITSAIDYVTTDNMPVMYVLQGHDELSMTDTMTELIEKGNIEIQELNLVTAESVPEDADCLFIYGPQRDLSEEEAEKIITYLEGGGKAFIVSGYTGTDMPNLALVLENYGLSTIDGLVFDGDANHYISGNPTYLVPEIQSADATGSMADSNAYVLLPYAQAIEETENHRDTITITSLLKTSDSAYIKENVDNITSIERESGDVEGTFDLAVAVEESYDDIDTKLVYITCLNIFNEQIDAMVSGGNTELLTNALSWMCCNMESTVSIPSKSLTVDYLTVTAAAARMSSMLTTIVLPVACLVIGGYVWFKRRRR